MRYVLAVVACGLEILAFAAICDWLGWMDGGRGPGFIPMLILAWVWWATWTAITKHREPKDGNDNDDTAPPRKQSPSVNEASASDKAQPTESRKNAEKRTSSLVPWEWVALILAFACILFVAVCSIFFFASRSPSNRLATTTSQSANWQPWQEVAVPGVCKFSIPPTMEIQGGSFADVAGELRHGMFGPDDSIKRVVIQQRGLNAFKGKAFDIYARVIVEVSRNPGESGLRQEYLRALTPADMKELDEVWKQGLMQRFSSAKALEKETRILECKPSKIVHLDNLNVWKHGYRRQLGDNPSVQVDTYLVPIGDLQCEVTVSYRESERSKWAVDLEKVMSSFEFEHRRK